MPRSVEARITRRWSAFDYDDWNPPQPMRPKTSPYYSWPRPTASGSSHTPLQEAPIVISYHSSASRRPAKDETTSSNTNHTASSHLKTERLQKSATISEGDSRESSVSSADHEDPVVHADPVVPTTAPGDTSDEAERP